MIRIDKLEPGTCVVLRFNGSQGRGTYDESAVFEEIQGDGDDRRATFRSLDSEGRAYSWEAYRYTGHWAYGSSAERLSLVEVSPL